MPFRGGPPPELGLGQVGQQAQPQVPGLLQMAQDAMDGGGRGGGGPMSEQVPMAGAAPAYNPGTTAGGYNAVFDPRAPTDGGWFTMADYNKGNTQGIGASNRSRPGSSTMLSTNNWRLLPKDYQNPDYFMIDGDIVSRRAAQAALAPKSVLGTEGTGFPGYNFMGGGQWMTPIGSQGAMQGHIGGLSPWATTSTPTY